MARRKPKMPALELRQASRADYPFLYMLLIERYEAGIDIGGRRPLPTYEEHAAFLDGKPYIDMVIAEHPRGCPVGMCYLDRNRTLGTFMTRTRVGAGIGVALTYLMAKRHGQPLKACQRPDNKMGWRVVERLGFTKTRETEDQLTWELLGPLVCPFDES